MKLKKKFEKFLKTNDFSVSWLVTRNIRLHFSAFPFGPIFTLTQHRILQRNFFSCHQSKSFWLLEVIFRFGNHARTKLEQNFLRSKKFESPSVLETKSKIISHLDNWFMRFRKFFYLHPIVNKANNSHDIHNHHCFAIVKRSL